MAENCEDMSMKRNLDQRRVRLVWEETITEKNQLKDLDYGGKIMWLETLKNSIKLNRNEENPSTIVEPGSK